MNGFSPRALKWGVWHGARVFLKGGAWHGEDREPKFEASMKYLLTFEEIPGQAHLEVMARGPGDLDVSAKLYVYVRELHHS